MKSDKFYNLCLTWSTWIIASIAVFVSSTGHGEISDYELKAAYIAHITEFVKWPRSSPLKDDNTFSICVFGNHPIEEPLAKLPKLMKVDKRPIIIRRIDYPEDALGCNMLFVPLNENGRITEIQKHIEKGAVLLINEVPSIPSHGQLISIYRDGNRLRIQVYLHKAQDAGFIISARLLKLANIVE